MKNNRETEARIRIQRSQEIAADLDRAKEVEFFAASVNAWYGTTMEHDKSIFALAAGGIGLLTTLLTTIGVATIGTFLLYVGSIACFITSLVAILMIFKKNRDHILAVVVEGQVEEDPKLARLDSLAMKFFGLGILLAAGAGIMTAYNSYITKGDAMATENKAQKSIGIAQDSANGCGNFTKSFNGAGKLQPAETATSKPAAQQTQQPAATPQKSGK